MLYAWHDVNVWNRNKAKAEPLGKRGAAVAAEPAGTARVGTVLTMLANDEAVASICFGKLGILTAGRDILHISFSTVSVELTERLTKAPNG